MLEGLDSVAWDKIPTAYDKGAQLPKLIKKLSSRSESVRDKALFDIREEIAHQGQIEPEAALAVAPFLIELIESPKVQGRDGLIRLLGDLACEGSSINWIVTPVVQAFEPLSKKFIDPHRELWTELLVHSDEHLVAATAFVVAFAAEPHWSRSQPRRVHLAGQARCWRSRSCLVAGSAFRLSRFAPRLPTMTCCRRVQRSSDWLDSNQAR
jgi:hypothetical protein